MGDYSMKIRKALTRDIPKLAYLMGELGYPTSNEEMSIRLKILNRTQAIVLWLLNIMKMSLV
jgi:hypothetical protein